MSAQLESDHRARLHRLLLGCLVVPESQGREPDVRGADRLARCSTNGPQRVEVIADPVGMVMLPDVGCADSMLHLQCRIQLTRW